MDFSIDTAIIGAGPAGLSCAMRLQKVGISNLVVEKKAFPREKTCGGLITEKTQRLLAEVFGFSAEELASLFCDASESLRLSFAGEPLTTAKLSTPFHLVKRKTFDKTLADRYREAGGKLLENTICEQIDPKNHTLVLSTGDTVAFKHLVVADGALSHTRARLGYKKPTLAFSVETQIPKEKLLHEPCIDLEFGFTKNGYAWIFPSGDTWCVGLVGLGKQKKPHDRLLFDLLASLGLDPADCDLKGAFVPYGKVVRQTRGQGDVILIGDAAGYADPISGEGLYFALKSGAIAAETIVENPKKLAPAYLARVSFIAKTIRQGTLLQELFFAPAMQKRFAKAARGRGAFVGFFCENLVHDYRYPYLRFGKLCREYKRGKK